MAKESDLREVSQKLETVIRLLAIDVIKGRELKDQVRLLDQAGLSPRDIAEILGKTPNAVRVALFTLRRTKSAST
jgi:DNA-directed RNA polymerase specialized sigma24 family protein